MVTLSETPEDYDKHFILTADLDLEPNRPGSIAADSSLCNSDGTT